MSRHPWLVIGCLWALLGVTMTAWVAIDRRPPEWDHANHLERALECHRALAEPGHDRAREVLEASSFYPPLAICATGLAYVVLPVTPLTAQAVMWAFLGLALACVFALGRHLWDGEAGLMAAFFLATAPFVVFSLTNFQLDVPLAAMVALALLALARAEGFSRPGWSLGVGMIVGLGMLTKPSFAVYLLAPLAWSAWRAARAPGRRPLAWAGLALVVAAAVALPWYGPRLVGLPVQILNRSFKLAAQEGHAGALSAAGALFYPRVLQPQFGLLAGLAFAWGAWALRADRRARALLWAAGVAPFVLFSLIQNKNLRYSLPILPAAALIAAAGIRSLGPPWRRWATHACLLLGLLQIPMAAFALPPSPRWPVFLTPVVFNHAPSGGDWQHEQILADIARAGAGRPASVAVVPNYNFLSTSTLRYEAARRRLPLDFTRAWEGTPLGVDFAVLKTGSQGPSFTADRPRRAMRALDDDPYLAAAYPVIGEYPLPDGSRAVLRARRVAATDAAPGEIARRLTADPGRFLMAYAREPAGLRVSVDYEPEAIRGGRVRRVAIEADSALVGEPARRDRTLLRVHDVRLVVTDLLMDPRRLVETGALAVLDAGRLRIERLTVTEDDLREFLHGQPAASGMSVTLGAGAADLRLARLGPPISARLRLTPAADGRPFALSADHVRVGPLPVPAVVADWILRAFDPTLRLRRLPVPVWLAPAAVRAGRIEVGGGSGPPSRAPAVRSGPVTAGESARP